jgi:hypothetical protein
MRAAAEGEVESCVYTVLVLNCVMRVAAEGRS